MSEKINILLQMYNNDILELPLVDITHKILSEYFDKYPDAVKVVPVQDRFSKCVTFFNSFSLVDYTDEELLAVSHHIYSYRGILLSETSLSTNPRMVDVIDLIFNYAGMKVERFYSEDGGLSLELSVNQILDADILVQMLEELLKDLVLSWNIDGIIFKSMIFGVELNIEYSISTPLSIHPNLNVEYFKILDFG